MGIIIDIVLVVVIALLVIASMRKGFISASKNIITLILTVTLLASLQGVVLDELMNSSLGDNIKETVSQNVTKICEEEGLQEDTDTTDTEKSLMICEAMSLPAFLSSSIEESIREMSEIKNNVMEVITDAITMLIMRVIALIILFVLVRLFVFLALKVLESLFKLPLLKTVNKTLGAVIGIFNALLVVYIICGVLSVVVPTDKLSDLNLVVEQTMIFKYFYNNNLLFSLFV